eukprot:TRINITY_DN19617_c0_g1_i9.p1 TRINITY_DN19617_c0_g1~~TRINITY_DN19617_c0_g1_i9.p1  ORF type:complete len:597 (-),score=62.85 TRINITY_DN19617_c0_g1_i9:698-2488(-)
MYSNQKLYTPIRGSPLALGSADIGTDYVHVTPLGYFLFCLAQYAVKSRKQQSLYRGDQSALRSALKALENVTQYVTDFGQDHNKLYLQILQSYLQLILPLNNEGIVLKVPMSQQLRQDCAVLMVSTFVEHWLTDENEPPLLIKKQPPTKQQMQQSHLRFQPFQQYNALSSELAPTIQLFFSHILKGLEVKHGQFYVPDIPTTLAHSRQGVRGGSSQLFKWLQNFGANSVQSLNKRLYRVLRRAICACAKEGTTVPHRPALQLYCAFISPWRNSYVVEEDSYVGYTPFWRKHVCANLPFYLNLLPLFMHVIAVRLGPAMRKEMVEDLDLLMESVLDERLLTELRMLERELRKHLKGELFGGDDPLLQELVPWVARQTVEWEKYALSDADGSYNSKDLMIQFTCFDERSEDGVQLGCTHVARWMVGQMEESSGHHTEVVIKMRQVFQIQGHQVDWEISGNENTAHKPAVRVSKSTGIGPGIKQGYIGDDSEIKLRYQQRPFSVLYQGDVLLRPIATYEFSMLVYPLVRLSQWANEKLELDRPYDPIEVPEDYLKMITHYLRKHDTRISFRILADKRLWTWIVVLFGLLYLVRIMFFAQ